MTKEEFLKRRNAIATESKALWQEIGEHRSEEERVINVLHNAEEILT